MIETPMSHGRRALLVLVLTVAALPAHAQLAQQAFQVVITRAGHDCPGIEHTRALGTSTNKVALVAVACTKGGSHVVAIHRDNRLSYMSSCEAFETGTELACFEDRSSR